jgi:GNAT superfamily N-acetyltransferase
MTPQSTGPRYQIHRYPATLIETRKHAATGLLTLRPILPQDEELLATFLNDLTPPVRRNRFHGAVNISPARLQEMSCVDYRHQMAVVITAQVDGAERLVADARYCLESDGCGAEFALVVAERWQRLGLGAWAMQSLQHAATRAGLEWLNGDVLQANTPMLLLMKRCGFALCPDPEDDQIVRAQQRLGHQAAPVPRARQGLRSRLRQAWVGHPSAALR